MSRIALTGLARSGKDSVANILTRPAFGSYHKAAFGDELKRHYHELFGYKKEKDREGYQWFGQVMRQRDEDIWVKKLDHSIEYFYETNKNLIITDLRQPNEYEYCRQKGYTIVKVECPIELRIERMRKAGDDFDEKDLYHETESYIDQFDTDFVIHNDGSRQKLFYQTFKLWEAAKDGRV